MREETFARQKELGVVPRRRRADAAQRRVPGVGLARRDAASASTRARWRSTPATPRTPTGTSAASSTRSRRWASSTTPLVIWIWGDNGASMEGTLTGTFNEMTTLNGIPLTPEQQMGLLFKHGGLEAWGGEQLGARTTRPAWAWAGNCPVRLGQAGRLAPRRHAQPAGRPLAERRSRDAGGRAQPLHARDRRRPDDPRARRDPGARRTSTGSSSSRCTASRFADSLSRRATRPSATRSSTSRRSATGRCTRTAGGSPAAAAHPLGARPRGAARLRPRVWDPDDDPVELYYLPDDFSQAQQPRGRASREGRGAARALLGGGRALPRAAAARRADLLLRHRAADPEGSRSSPTAAGSRTSPPG